MANDSLIKNIFILVLLSAFSINSFAQTSTGTELDANIYYAQDKDVMGSVSASLLWRFNKRVDVSAGLMLLYSKIDVYWKDNQEVHYSIDDKIKKLNGQISSTVVQPIYKGWGLFGRATFIFEPIPVSNISLHKISSKEPSSSSSKYVFTQFNPGGMIDVGIYKEFKRNGTISRIYLGVGYGYYDLYKRYRGVTLYNQNLSDHVPTDKSLYRISIRVSG